jgi:hypothetical protein
METRTGDRMQSLPAYGVSRRHKDADSGAEQVFEICASIGYPLGQMSTTGKLQSTVRLVVIITVEHYFKAPCGDTRTEIVDECSVFMQGMHRPPASEFVGHCFTCSGTMEGDHSKRDRTPSTHLAVDTLKLLGRGEKAGVIVTNTEMHSPLLYV